MMDNFREEVASKHNRLPGMILYGLSWVGIVVFGIIATMAFSSLTSVIMSGQLVPILITIAQMLIFGGLAVLIWFKKDNAHIEYDYTFTNGDLDVGKVFGNSRRRLMTSLAMKNVEAAGKVTHQSFQRFMNDKDVKKHNWFVNREADLCYFYFVKENDKKVNVKHVIVLELSDEMLTMAKPYLKFGVWQG